MLNAKRVQVTPVVVPEGSSATTSVFNHRGWLSPDQGFVQVSKELAEVEFKVRLEARNRFA